MYFFNIVDQPVVSIISLPSTDITEGSNVSIVCKSDANPKVLDLQLFKDGKSVLHTDSDHNSLDMKNFTRSHAGKYKCICRNIIGTGGDEIQLNVLCKCLLPFNYVYGIIPTDII